MRKPGNGGEENNMHKTSSKLLTALALAGLVVPALQAAEAVGIDGKWFAYPGQVDPQERTLEPPAAIPDPPP